MSILAQNCPRLNSLLMEKVTFDSNDNDSVPVLNNLENISFEKLTNDSLTTQAVIRLLSPSPNLKRLGFRYCEMFSSDIKTQILKCCEQCELEDVDFTYSDVELEFVQDVLLTCSSLVSLNLDGCEVARSYAEMEELESLALTLPNRPVINYSDHIIHGFSDSDDSYYDYYDDDYDYDYDDENDVEDEDNDDEDINNPGYW